MQWRIIGCGNLDRGDDAAGLLVVRRLRTLGIEAEEQSGESFALLDSWSSSEHVVLVDAVCSGEAPGNIQAWDACANPLPEGTLLCSTHAFGLRETVELARATERLPHNLIIYGIEGKQFAPGMPLSPEVENAVELLTQQLAEQVQSWELVGCSDFRGHLQSRQPKRRFVQGKSSRTRYRD